MIFLACFFPVAVYLLILGGINRRRYPLLVSGVWDFIGLLFALSGFLLLAGPAILASLSERGRNFWLLARINGLPASLDGSWRSWVWAALSILYFVLVVAGSAFLLRQQRRLTAIYNADAGLVQRCLEHIFEQMRLHPVRSGNLYLFGLAGESARPPAVAAHESIQGPHCLPGAITTRIDSGHPPAGGEGDFLGQTAILEIEEFAGLRHVTLRWEPVDNLFRREIESQLQQVLARTPTEESEIGAWMLVIGLGLLALLFLGGIILLLVRAWLFRG